MSRVDTSIGFSLRSEPPSLSASFATQVTSLKEWSRARSRERSAPLAGTSIGIVFFHIVQNSLERGWRGWGPFVVSTAGTITIGAIVYGLFRLWIIAKLDRQVRAITIAGFDSPVVHLTAEGQWVTFRFASDHEFVDRWDRLRRFKSAPEFTEFEFPANPPIIIATMAIPVETIRTITQFCDIEKIPSETKR